MRLQHWFFIAAAAIPCAALLIFCGVGIHEWWLIKTAQIVVIPTPTPGASSAPEVPATRLVPLIFGSGMLAALYAYALLRRSRAALLCAYLAIGLLIAWHYLQRI